LKKKKKNEKKNKKSNQLDFDKKTLKIKYPRLTDDDFIVKIDEILKQKISNKFIIENIDSKTMHEILNLIPEKDRK
jgi:hypothetical protein